MKYICSIMLSITMFISCADSDTSEKPVKKIKTGKSQFAVVLNDNAAVRFQPQLYTSRIDYLNKGDNVEVLDHSAEQSRIGGTTDYWYYISLPSGVAGWTFGSNIKILEEGDDFSIEDYKKQISAEKMERTIKQLKGKWWSVNKYGNFTSHMLMIYPDGTYKSSRGGYRKEGKYFIDMDKQELAFSEGTSVGEKINFITRGQELVLEIEKEESTYRFKKIASETDDEEKERLESYQIEDLEETSAEEPGGEQ